MKPRVVLTKGLPASGKSTWAKQVLAGTFPVDYPGPWKRINKDDLRAMLDNSRWSKDNEKHIVAVRNILVDYFTGQGYNVIVDDTNLNPEHIRDITELLKDKADIEEKDFTDVPVDECIKRDLARPTSVGSKVILDMHNRWIKTYQSPPVVDPSLQNAYIIDIDGTLAKMHGRGPYEFDKIGTDVPNEAVVQVVLNLAQWNNLIIVSGREEKYREVTTDWLNRYIKDIQDNPLWDILFMRPTDDTRNDAIVKQEIYEREIKGKYNIRGVFDDRPRVIRMWRSLGLPVFDVGPGFEF